MLPVAPGGRQDSCFVSERKHMAPPTQYVRGLPCPCRDTEDQMHIFNNLESHQVIVLSLPRRILWLHPSDTHPLTFGVGLCGPFEPPGCIDAKFHGSF